MSFELQSVACEKEPIHVPGAIQPHGYLLACNPDSSTIVAVSENIGEIFAELAQEILGRSIKRYLPDVYVDVMNQSKAIYEHINPQRVHGLGLDAIAHRNAQGYVIVEFEREQEHLPSQGNNFGERLNFFLQQFELVHSIDAFFTMVSARLRELLGFDRIAIYKFYPDWHGEIVGESKADGVESFKGFHYPESDIPAQARELYLVNPIRIIPFVDYEPVPVCQMQDKEPLDLSLSSLRSVSPWHRQYMRHMGLQASMSLSIIIDGRLWGLILCHSYQPRSVSYEARYLFSVIGKFISSQIAVWEDKDVAEKRSQRLSAIVNFLKAANHLESLIKGLENSQCIQKLFSGCGFARACSKQIVVNGTTPSVATITQLSQSIASKLEVDQVYTNDSLQRDFPNLQFGAVAGVLCFDFIRLGEVRRFFIFRSEVIQTLAWGGNPKQKIIRLPSGELGPRLSFARWLEERRGHSLPWTDDDRQAARDLKDAFELLLRKSVGIV